MRRIRQIVALYHFLLVSTNVYNDLYLVWLELWQHVTSGSYPQRTEENIHYAMDMMERKTVNDVIIFTPLPCFHQSTDLRPEKKINNNINTELEIGFVCLSDRCLLNLHIKLVGCLQSWL